MKKTFLVLALIVGLAGIAHAYTTENTTVTTSAWIITAGDGGVLRKCVAHGGSGEYLVKITTTTGATLGWMRATTNSTDTLDFTDWTGSSGAVGFEPVTAGVFLTEVSGVATSFTNCAIND